MFARALIVLLLILNLGVAAWWWLRPEPPARTPPVQPAGVPRLQLLGEMQSRPSAAAAAPATAAPATVPAAAAESATATEPVRCFAVGPFADAAAAAAARTALSSVAVQATPRTERRARSGGAWSVRVPPQADRAAAQALAQRIDAAGFKDYYIIGEGTGANGIALGRFGNEQAARRHQAALQAAGFAVEIEAPQDAQPRYWLDLRANAGFDAETARTRVSAPLQPADC